MTGTLVLAQISKEELQKEILHTWEAAKHTWVIPIHIGPVDLSINKIIWFLFLGAAISFLVLYVGARLLKDRPGAYQVVVEELYGFGRNYLGGQIGEAGMKWFPYTLSIFVFLLTLNIIGLFPGSYPVTSNLSFTATLALITFILTHYMGIKRNGAGAYFRSWVPEGLPARVFMAPFMFFIHTISEIARPITLAVRLYANILAGHLIIFVFLSFILYFGTLVAFISVPAALIFYAFEIFVAVLQAYIFAILTQVYIELAIYAEDTH
ncbi:MAG: F0F1 ATP synthase subunit A [Rubrobacteraceae bacterium]|nr:F0F1 ATP synthase subunit A [Rubrobacteraceae bacterium]MDQ3252239.1 F0F1 ATP synthase subunit A [Actinomycetota bacterium]MDQ3438427.1 F0F1 ATP synthase subunit A [Actinomycetota bacterium]